MYLGAFVRFSYFFLGSNIYIILCAACFSGQWVPGDTWLNNGWILIKANLFADGSVFIKEPRSYIHSSLQLHLTIGFPSNNSLPAPAAATMRGRDQSLHCFLSSRTSRRSLSPPRWLQQAVLQRLWPQCVWYYSRLNVGFTRATRIKWVAARTCLSLRNAVNRFAEWEFNVYTDIASTSWSIIGTLTDVVPLWEGVSLLWWLTDAA